MDANNRKELHSQDEWEKESKSTRWPSSYGGKERSAKKCELYQQNPDENRGEKLEANKEMLEKVNVDIADKDLNEVIDEIVSNDNKHNHKAS